MEKMEEIKIKETNPFLRILIALALWLTSVILKYLTAIISIIVTPIYYLITFKWKSGTVQLADWIYNMALSNDQHGNVTAGTTLRLLFTRKGGEPFGNPDDTVSYVLARNKYQQRLTFLGKGMCWLLDKIDHSGGGHMKKAIHMKRLADDEAVERRREDNYYFEK